jgi:ribonuclease D
LWPQEYHYQEVPSQIALNSILDYIVSAQYKVIAIDLETTGLDPLQHELTVLSLAVPAYCWVIPNTSKVDLCCLKGILESPNVTKLVQYAPFDWGFLKRCLCIDMKPCYDTKAVEKSLGYVGEENSLKAIVKRRFGKELVKGKLTLSFESGRPLSEAQVQYAALDALTLFPIMVSQAVEIYQNALNKLVGVSPTGSKDPLGPMRKYVEHGKVGVGFPSRR